MTQNLQNKLKQNEGKVVALDLANGATVTTRVKSVGEGEVTVGKIMVYHPVPNPQNPTEMQVRPIPYGAPLFEVGETTTLSIDHIIMMLDVPDEMAKAYTQQTSGIQVANANALDQLQGLDLSGLGKS